jgi:hypothetical protein
MLVTAVLDPVALRAFCYAPTCRRVREWKLHLRSAPVYECTSCGMTREIAELGRPPRVELGRVEERLPRACVEALRSLDRHRPGGYAYAREAAARAPYCSCCGTSCAVVNASPVRRCACDPFAVPCPKCSRGPCHCRC